MALLALQSAGDSSPPTPQPVNVTVQQPPIDFGAIGRGLVDGLENAIPTLGTAIAAAFGGALRAAWDGIWNSGANLVGHTDPAWTIDFGPAGMLRHDGLRALYGILFLAIVMLCVRSLVQAFTGGGGVLDAAVEGVGTGLFLVVGYLIYLAPMVAALNRAADAIGRADLGDLLGGGLPADPLTLVILLLLLLVLIFGLRLLIRTAYRMGMLALLSGFGVIALPLRMLPFSFTRRISDVWVQQFHGWLWGQLPSIAALTIGVQMATRSGGVMALIFTIAFCQLAYDVYDICVYGMGGGGSALGMVFSAARTASSLFGGGAGAAAAGTAVSSSTLAVNQHLADRYGY